MSTPNAEAQRPVNCIAHPEVQVTYGTVLITSIGHLPRFNCRHHFGNSCGLDPHHFTTCAISSSGGERRHARLEDLE